MPQGPTPRMVIDAMLSALDGMRLLTLAEQAAATRRELRHAQARDGRASPNAADLAGDLDNEMNAISANRSALSLKIGRVLPHPDAMVDAVQADPFYAIQARRELQGSLRSQARDQKAEVGLSTPSRRTEGPQLA